VISLPHWWPLVVGFVMVWLLRLMGMEPTGPAPGTQSADGTKPQSADTKDTRDTKESQINH